MQLHSHRRSSVVYAHNPQAQPSYIVASIHWLHSLAVCAAPFTVPVCGFIPFLAHSLRASSFTGRESVHCARLHLAAPSTGTFTAAHPYSLDRGLIHSAACRVFRSLRCSSTDCAAHSLCGSIHCAFHHCAAPSTVRCSLCGLLTAHCASHLKCA